MIQTRIKQRFDTLENWIQDNIVLLPGELAVVDCGQQTRFKVGDGTKSFTQLPFVDQNQLCTKWIVADAVSQGRHSFSVPYGFAAGAYLSANAIFSQAFGYNAETISSDAYSFVWNGNDTSAIGDYYSSHGKGTFSINPLSGLSGVYIGEDTLASILESNDAVPAIFKTVQMVKPWSAGERLHARMTIARDDQFEDVIAQSIDTAVNGNYNFLKAFTNDGASSSQWTTMPSNGFYTDANDVPVIFALHEALSALGETPTISSEYYIKYYWYFNDGETEHRSDEFSIAVPTNTTVGAIPADSIHRSDFEDLRHLVVPGSRTSKLGEEYAGIYSCVAEQVVTLSGEISDATKILLEDYEYGKSYKIKFTTSNAGQVHLAFFVDNGNSPEYFSSFELNRVSADYTFEPSHTYLVEVQAEAIKVNPLGWHSASLSADGDFITKETLSSLAQVGAELATPAIFRNVQLVKPGSAGDRMHLKLDIARDDQFQSIIAANFDTASGSNYKYLKHFVSDGVSGTWETMTSVGLYTDANDAPASFYLGDALSDLGEHPAISSQYFMRYYWYYELSGVVHKSDQFSIAVPSNTAVGANPGDVIHRDEFYDIRQDVTPLKKTIGLDEDYERYYIGQTGIVADIEDELTGTARFLLEDYQFGNTYRFKFSTGSSACTAEFYVDNGNGPEKDTSLQINIDTYTFLPDTSYQIEVQGDVVRVDTLGYSASSGGGGGGSGGSGPYRYPLIVASPVSSDTSSLTYVIQDHAVTTIEISSASKAVKVKLPEKQDDGARDFIIRVEISSSTTPDFSFLGVDETLTFDSDNEDWYVLEPGLNLVSFTETRA